MTAPSSTRFRILVMPWLVVWVAWPVFSAGFHQGGVASCGGCHVIHDSVDGSPLAPGRENGFQLMAQSPSDLCLSCHATNNGSVLALNPLFPSPEKGAGNFSFLLENNLNDAVDGRIAPIPGFAAGHNLAAPGFGLNPDPRFVVAPGGTFRSEDLGCTSCHDPHGSSSFRMLNGVGEIQGGIATFVAPAPRAIGIGIKSDRERLDNHTAYLEGMSRWCGNCHGRYHDEGFSEFEHPIDEPLETEIVNRYNRYDGEDNPDDGRRSLAYLPDVPFEDFSSTTDGRSGPVSSSQIMCLSCHRAHATSAPGAGRWDFNISLLSEDGVQSGSWPIPDPYNSPNQGSLCRKCHQTIPN